MRLPGREATKSAVQQARKDDPSTTSHDWPVLRMDELDSAYE